MQTNSKSNCKNTVTQNSVHYQCDHLIKIKIHRLRHEKYIFKFPGYATAFLWLKFLLLVLWVK